MATFSLGTSGVTPGAPGVYINEQAGKIATAAISGFSTVYMLTEADETVSVTTYPFNTPIPVTSVADYQALLGGAVPDSGMPLLSYQCVDAFFNNAQVGDLRVVRVGTPNQIVEIEILPSGSKINTTDLPSALMAGNKVYVQMVINGLRLVAGDGSTGYTANGDWLGVPVTIPVNYVAGDEVNNRKISRAIVDAIAAAIKSNPAVSSSVIVRDFGLLNELDPVLYANSENGFVNISSSTFDGNVSVVTEVFPVGSNYVLMQNAYDLNNIVGGGVNLERVPQDYIQCIETAFDGQQDQGYLVTPTAYAQFTAEGRAAVGAAAAAHCASNSYKWMALADPGPYYVTQINKYNGYTPHAAASDFVSGLKYLIDNVIYEWTGNDVTYDRLTYQSIVPGQSAQTAINEAANLVAATATKGLLDSGIYTINSTPLATIGKFTLSTTEYWPVTLPIQKVTLSGAGVGNDFANVNITGGAAGVNLNGQEVYVIAPPFNSAQTSEYSLNTVYLATTATDASNIYNAVVLAGGTNSVAAAINGCVVVAAPTSDTATITYSAPYWDLPVTINGQTSDLVQNISGSNSGVNTLHLPGTLQKATQSYILGWVSRTILNPAAAGLITSYAGTVINAGAAVFNVPNHGLRDGQRVFFTQPITVTSGSTTTSLVSATNKLVTRAYLVKVLTTGSFAIATSLGDFTANTFITLPTGTLSTTPSIFYTQVSGRGLTTISPTELVTLPMIRGRKYSFDSSSIFNEAADASVAPAPGTAPATAVYINNSAQILGQSQINPYGEDLNSITLCDWLPSLNLVAPTLTPSAAITNAYCSPTVDQFYQSEAYFVPAIQPILVGDYTGVTGSGTIGPALTVTFTAGGAPTLPDATYNNVPVTGGSGTGLTVTITIAAGAISSVTISNPGQGYATVAGLTLPAGYNATVDITAIDNLTSGSVVSVAGTTYATQLGLLAGDSGAQLNTMKSVLVGSYFTVSAAGVAPDGTTAVAPGDFLGLTYDGSTYTWVVVAPAASGGDLTTLGQACYGSQVEITFSAEQTPAVSLWNFDAITSTELINNALRGVGFNGIPQAKFIESGVDNVNRLSDDSQRYFDPFGFIAYYGPWIDSNPDDETIWLPPSPYVTGVAVRRYRAEGYQFPPAGVKYQLAGAYKCQIPINSAQQNLLNPEGCNAIRTLPGYPQTSVFIWGGRTRVNAKDAQQRLYQFVNTRVILNVVYGSLRNAFDSQIFNVIDGFGVVFNQIISIGNSILNQLYVKGALFGARPADAFQVICDGRINSAADLENGIVNAKVFVTPVPTLERIQIDLIRVAIGQMNKELDIQGLGSSNS